MGISQRFQRLAQDELDGIKNERGYWTINEGRLLCKSFSGLATPGDLTVDDNALQMCLQMGQGLEKGKSHLKVETSQNLKRCAAFLEQQVHKGIGSLLLLLQLLLFDH